MKRYVYAITVVFIMLLIYFLSDTSNLSFFSGQLPPQLRWLSQYSLSFGKTGFFSYVISLHPDWIIHKAGHFVMYGMLGAALYMAIGKSVSKAMLVTVLFAVSDELHQGFVAGRSSRLGDIILDTASASLFIFILYKKIKNRHIK